ncbi:hypothetical protein CBOM_01077 [Ceraceosorus bombacis]|uniref:Uncharacterized protein n=1 Tax=Ceraceosorus bombacis TaxID=401625 RepID=A0A0N7L992_9BASI|nr:hypothetical protein CBOM_01077 [Ceraceosorus bombacis]
MSSAQTTLTLQEAMQTIQQCMREKDELIEHLREQKRCDDEEKADIRKGNEALQREVTQMKVASQLRDQRDYETLLWENKLLGEENRALRAQYDQVDREADLHVGKLMDLTIKVDELVEKNEELLADNSELKKKLEDNKTAIDSLKKEVLKHKEDGEAGLAREFEAMESLELERQVVELEKADFIEHIAQLRVVKQRDDATIAELRLKVDRLESRRSREPVNTGGTGTASLPSGKYLPPQRSAPLGGVLLATEAQQAPRPSALALVTQLREDAGESSSMRSHEGVTYTTGPRSHSWFKWTDSGLRVLYGSPNSSGAISLTANDDDFAGPDSDYSSSSE